jgi:N-sulfoglucosamine sulfohydrolase
MDRMAGVMERRAFLTGFAGAGAAGALQVSSRVSRPPNILYIHSHDSGRYLQPYGAPVPAPNLQKLAEGGVLFRQAFSAAPTCSPSRAALLTGQSPHASGMLGLAHRGFALHDYKQHILHALRPHGYVSVLAGIQHIAKTPRPIGYDEVLSTRSTRAEHVTPAAVAFLGRKQPNPWYFEVGYFETHREFHPPGPAEDPRFTQPAVPVPDTPRTRADMAAFKASARVMDEAVGQVLTALERTGQAANTLVISTTDHGIAFPAMKCNCTDHGMGVSLVMRGPNGFEGGKVCDAMVSQIDVFPTLCEYLGIGRPEWLTGKSMLPLFHGSAREINDEVFAEVTYHAAYEPLRAVRTHRWKYVRHFGGKHTPVLPNCDDGASKSLWVENGWRDRPVADESLYDLMFDPAERANIASDPAVESILRDMRGRLDSWMEATNDPLLKGPVPLPPGCVVNDPNGTSPQEQPH